ncbi:hypothetical protein QEJ31_11060 [Pigmentibacter sp. JX0631]|uniref:hypothetical protein n=1 Tax=Pigmentibacter sp. JX0631 TaxID=2976982 RepID=UPI0024692A79|nr:hypothetical protein [Pigmentibacter sp. JX0631]WGL59058.1 hypothetical protein QEJ31_11060 [Pigmentibacter sp. JX0631]
MKILAASIAFLVSSSALACFAPIKEQDEFEEENYNNYIDSFSYAVDIDLRIMDYCKPYAAIIEQNNEYKGNFSIYNLWYDFSFAYIKLQYNNTKNSNIVVLEPSESSPFICNGSKLEHKLQEPIISTSRSILKTAPVRIKFLNTKNNKNYLTTNTIKNTSYFSLNKKGSEFQLGTITKSVNCYNLNDYCTFDNNKELQLKFIPLH